MVNHSTRVSKPGTEKIIYDCNHSGAPYLPAVIGGLAYIAIKEAESAKADTVQVLDESKMFTFESNKRFTFVPLDLPLEQAKKVYNETDDFALLYIPAIDINKPEGVAIYTKVEKE